MKSKYSKPSIFKRHPIWLATGCLLVAAAVMAGLELTNTTHLFHKAPTVTAGPATKGIPTNNDNTTTSSKSNSSSATVQGAINTQAVDTNQTLYTPTGPFVSNHFPNLGGSPAPNTINSVCTTTSGATCQIIFTKGSVTKSLPAEVTDKGGSAYWNGWKLQDVGLTAGDWQITAKVTLGSQTKTAADALDLKVSP